MSDVWLGALRGPAGFSKLVAVKQLRMVGNAEYDGGAAFLREARLAALLNHPNIVHTFEVLAQGGDYRIVMEFLEGQPLNRILRKNTPISLRDYVRVVADLLAGLHHAHELTDFDGSPMRVVHLDVSPQNVFVTWEGMVKLLDFGIASFGRATHAEDGLVKGKLSYMAPEQARGEPVDRRTDVFAAGSVLFEILAGTPMWGGMTEAQVVHGLGHGIIPSIDDRAPTAPEPLRLIVRKATSAHPRGRFST
ncbi:MAG: serine/threonine-protein kinase, partial [Myxococcota bacterium]